MDNTAIARIADHDLTSDTLALLKRFSSNDDVVFFLGRLVWQGQMSECVPELMEIAGNPSRGRYARIAAARGVMSVGSDEQKEQLRRLIADDSGPLDRDVLAELLEWSEASIGSVRFFLHCLERVAPPERFSVSNFDRVVHTFIERLPVMADQVVDQPLGVLIAGLGALLRREPFVERGECHVSKEYKWLMSPALHAVDRLVAARAVLALSSAAIAIMQNSPVLGFWKPDEASEFTSSLAKNVPRWHELNDLLYWSCIAEARANLTKKGQELVGDWQIRYLNHFWGFGLEDFERCLEWVRTKKDHTDRVVALSRCVQLFVQADRPVAWLTLLQEAIRGDETLEDMLEVSLNPKPSPVMLEMEAENRKWKRQSEARERKEKKRRADWVRELTANPDRVRHPPSLKPGEFSGDQYHLMLTAMRRDAEPDQDNGAHWHRLIPEFGEAVARAYRDAAVAHWRAYKPVLRSEGAPADSTPYSLIFGMTGLAIEAGEDSAFAQRLTADEACHAFRYVAWQLNGFPSWFEPLYRAHPKIGYDAVTKELLWELEHSTEGETLHYILHDIVYHAPWLHAEVAPVILEWLRGHDMPNSDGLRYCLAVLNGGGTTASVLAELAANKAAASGPAGHRPRWLALWVDADPTVAIPAVEAALEQLPADEARTFAQEFIVALLGDRHGAGTRIGAYRNAQDLKKLYLLMHRFVRVADDIERVGKGAYSPTLRDDAQEARNALFNILASTPGPDAYAAIKSLEEEHPEVEYRRWMARRARERATVDADEPLWTVRQVYDFAQRIAGS